MDTVELGGNISLSGFSERDFTEMIVVKKVVGQYARKFSDGIPGFSKLDITLKTVHQTEDGHGKFEIITKMVVGAEEYDAEVTDRNLFVGLDLSLKRVQEQAQTILDKHSHR